MKKLFEIKTDQGLIYIDSDFRGSAQVSDYGYYLIEKDELSELKRKYFEAGGAHYAELNDSAGGPLINPDFDAYEKSEKEKGE